jgi:acetamidase/formamidase
MSNHVLKATSDTVHLGGFDPFLKPALWIQSGDRVEVETFTGYALVSQAPAHFVPPELKTIVETLAPERKVGPGPHLLTGPIAVEGSEPGDVLEIRLEQIWPRLPVGFNALRSGWGVLSDQFTQDRLRFIDLDLENKVAEFPPNSGIHLPLKPFFGIIGVATDELARSSVPPGVYGGNLDNRHLQAGSRLFLPVWTSGGLLSLGDGHSMQGDGEVCVTALETSMNGRIQVLLHKQADLAEKGIQLPAPMAETADHWITMGFGETLDQALVMALEKMVAFLSDHTSLDPESAYVLCSLGVNFHITQAVNAPQRGVHGLLPKTLVRELNLLNWD